MKFYHVDAFADELFKGNPAGVCILGDRWPDDSVMQNIAFENNLSETAFVICQNGEYSIRWFTPTTEVDLCGHATFASFHALVNHEGFSGTEIRFKSKRGVLRAEKNGERLTIDLPAEKLVESEYIWDFECFDVHPKEIYHASNDFLFVFENESQIKNITCNLENVRKVDSEGIIVTARGDSLDFVSRFFAPNVGIDEDPVTGSAHTLLVPYWAGVTGKTVFEAAQLSKRSGRLSCKLRGDRVLLSGRGVTYMTGNIILP